LTEIDPFEDVEDTTVEPAPKPTKAKPKVATSEDGKLTVTLKGGAGFDAPWIVVHTASVDEALEVFQSDASKLATLMDRVQSAGKHFTGLAPAKPAGGGAPARPGAEAPAGTPEAPGPDWVYKTGVNAKTGKPWKAWMPPRGSDAQPVWL
jgi:hypothetical protein